MLLEPSGCQRGDGVERTGFLEQVRGSGDDLELRLAPKLPKRLAVQADDRNIVTSHDEQGGALNPRELLAG